MCQTLTCTLVQEVGQEAAHDGLVADDQNVLLPLQLHDDRFQPLHQVLIGLLGEREVRPSVKLQPESLQRPAVNQFNLNRESVVIHLSLGVSVAVLVLVSQGELQREVLLDLLVHHLLTNSLWDQKKQDQTRDPTSSPGCCSEKLRTASISLRDFHCS